MTDEGTCEAKVGDGSVSGAEIPSVQAERKLRSEAPAMDDSRTIVLASTFTVDPLKVPLKFWTDTIGVGARIEISPYAQVMQELLNPESLLSRNTGGFNVLLVRAEDWIRDRRDADVEENIEHVWRMVRDFIASVAAFQARTSALTLVFLCPAATELRTRYGTLFEEVQSELVDGLHAIEHLFCWTHDELSRLYPVSGYEDRRADRVGHIPYTNEYFVAIATLLARRIAALLKPQCKVIAIDCDNTLWCGICGEDGAAGVEITKAHLEFQTLLVHQQKSGVLLCLCSKNNAPDVEAVFREHPEMPLRMEHLVASRVNWNSKSANLQSLAQELDLSLDSFIFVDDSPLECAEVRAHCPAVLTLQFPEHQEQIAHFLAHVWAFDRVVVTKEAQNRTEQYKQNKERARALEHAVSLEQFIASLQLKVDVAVMQPDQLARVAELVQRTNQFNLTTIRRTSTELELLCSRGELQCLVVHVQDRFGDYGLVGALLLRRAPPSIDVDTFVLSCRVLGRGVEGCIVAELGRIARSEGFANIVLNYRPTPRNGPAWLFIDKAFRQFRRPANDGDQRTQMEFIIPAHHALISLGNPVPTSVQDDGELAPLASVALRTPADWKWHETACRLSRVADIVQEISRSTPERGSVLNELVAPRTPVEAVLADIWAEVLGRREISVRADFLDLGGDSILAVQVITRVGAVLGLELSIYDFFEGPTIEQVAQKLAGAPEMASRIPLADRARPLSLSWAQQRLWFIDKLEGGSQAYHIPLAIKLTGQLDRVSLISALDALVERHEVLRTVFVEVNAEPAQEILPTGHFPLRVVDLRPQPAEVREEEVIRQSKDQLGEAFELSVGPLIRGRLLQLSTDEHVLLIAMHHIVSDGWSLGIMVRELGLLYQAHVQGQPSPLPPLSIQYADYAQWQRLAMADVDDQLRFWREHLQGAPDLLALPTDRQRPVMHSYRGGTVALFLEARLASDLKALSRRHNVTLAMTLHAAFVVLLARLSGQEDIVIGMPVANRRRAELEGVIGFFANTLVARIRIENDPSVAELLQHVKQVMLGVHTNQDVPFEQVVEAVRPVRSLSHSPIFQVMFVLHNAPRAVHQASGLRMVEQETMRDTAQFDLTLELQEVAGGISGGLNYATDLFEVSTIERWAEHFKTVLSEMVRNPHRRVDRLSLVPERDRLKIVRQFNRHTAGNTQYKLIQELFEEQVARAPDAVAVVCGAASLTYAELDDKATRLGWHLRSRGIGPDHLVAIFAERSLELILGLLAVWKTGAAYLPLDPRLPPQRLTYMLGDAQPRLVLIQKRLSTRFPESSIETFAIDSHDPDAVEQPQNVSNHDRRGVNAARLAYVIYTSGSTGRPKGVMIEHRNVLDLWQGLEPIYRSSDCERIALNASLSFDASVQQLVQLLSGRTLFMVLEEARIDAAAFLDFIETRRIDGIDCTPSQLRSWIAAGLLDRTTKHRPRVILVGGEAIDPDLWRQLAQCTEIRFFNVYGPTECTVDATVARLDVDATAPHIGLPMENRRVYVMDSHLQPLPVGIAGEIYIGGAGIGRGYLNRPALTAERFLPDPFSADPYERIYRTGDLGRYRADGTIDYLGRVDHQVKIRGFRVELGEIESRLVQHPHVKEAVVLAREARPDDRLLVAYIVAADEGRPSEEDLRVYLVEGLPEHMLPSAFVMVDRMPLTSSGKVDRRALSALEISPYQSPQYVPPQGEIEETLARIWRELLHLRHVGRHDNFFDVGGHSLLVVKAVSRINDSLRSNLRVVDVYGHPTIRQLAARVAGSPVESDLIDLSQEAALSAEYVPVEGELARGVMLTGATGFVGRFLLVQLLQETDSNIYCLVRAQSQLQAKLRIRSTLAKWDLWRDEFEHRIVAIPGDLRKQNLALDSRTWQMLSHNVGTIYHCGASMNHLETYPMAKSANVQSARELLKLATRERPKLINYISTLSVFSSLPATSVVDERSPIDHEKHSIAGGYAASKWVAESIFMTASERGIPCNIFRVGLVWADTQEGRYDALQREYRIIKSCLLSGYGIGDYRPDMPPTPVDYVARAVVFLGAKHRHGGGIFHISSSTQFLHGLFERCNEIAGTSLEIVPYYEWIREIKRLHSDGHSLPAVPLVEFAFSLDEQTFEQERRRIQITSGRFNCERTHQELESAGIVAPSLNDDLFAVCVESMFSRDEDLQGTTMARAI